MPTYNPALGLEVSFPSFLLFLLKKSKAASPRAPDKFLSAWGTLRCLATKPSGREPPPTALGKWHRRAGYPTAEEENQARLKTVTLS